MPNLLNALGAVVVLSVCSACVSPPSPMTNEAALTLVRAKLVTRQGETPDFIAYTPGWAGLGLIGLAKMKSNGREFVSESRIEDPAGRISASLRDDLIARFDAVSAEAADNADFALDVATKGWSYVSYLVSDADLPYRVDYAAQATLTDLRSGAVIADGSCRARPGDKETAPNLEELRADGGAVFKRELDAAIELCLEELRSTVFNAETDDPAA